MPWWPYWEGEWYEALPWVAAAIIFGTLFGWRFGMWLIEHWDLTQHHVKWEPHNKQPWWKRLWDLLKGGRG